MKSAPSFACVLRATWLHAVWVPALALSPANADQPAVAIEQEIHELVESLASGNAWPKRQGVSPEYLVFPADFDWDAYSRVANAVEALKDLGIVAFPELVAHAKDSRFCCVTMGLTVHEMWSVGRVCECIVHSQVAVYHYEVAYDDRWMPSALPGGQLARSKQSLEEWWRENRDKSLLEMQLLATEYALDATRSRDPRPSKKADVDRRKRNIKQLKRLIAELRKSDNPKPPVGLGIGRIVPKTPQGDKRGQEVRLIQGK